jgi:hypothetical protein
MRKIGACLGTPVIWRSGDPVIGKAKKKRGTTDSKKLNGDIVLGCALFIQLIPLSIPPFCPNPRQLRRFWWRKWWQKAFSFCPKRLFCHC